MQKKDVLGSAFALVQAGRVDEVTLERSGGGSFFNPRSFASESPRSSDMGVTALHE